MEQRFLITEISRWNRPDPAFLHDPSLVLKQKEDLVAYHYVDNCPLTYLDPNGERKNWFVQKLKSAYRWSRKNVFHTGRINQKNLRDPNFQKHTRKFVTVTAPKAMKAVIEAMFVAEAVAGARLAYQGWKFARMGAKALAKGGASAAKSGTNLTKSQQKSIRSLGKRIAEHQKKLSDYKANPGAFDNKGILQNAPNEKIRQQIIDKRIQHLEKEIKTFQNNINKIINLGS